MGCTGDKNDDEYSDERPNQRRVRQRQNYQEEEEIEEEEPINDEKEFKDFEEIGSKDIK